MNLIARPINWTAKKEQYQEAAGYPPGAIVMMLTVQEAREWRNMLIDFLDQVSITRSDPTVEVQVFSPTVINVT